MLEGLSNLSAFKGIDPKQIASLQGQGGAMGQLIPSSDMATLQKAPSLPGATATPNPTMSLANVQSGGGAFERTFDQFVGDVNAKQGAATEAVHGLISGQGSSLHQTMISMEEAHVSFQLMVEVRNKLLESYQELMRMQI